jgi:hypothetical protein
VVVAPALPAAGLAFVSYAALTGVAWSMRGRKCACFGVTRLASIGRTHIRANALAALVAAAGAVLAGATPTTASRALAAGVGVVGTIGLLLVVDLRARRVAEPARCDESIFGVQVYVTDDCPSCRSLKQLLTTMEPARQTAVAMTLLRRGDELPDGWSGLGVPSAVGLDASGTPVCAPVDGIGAVKNLIDTVTIGAGRAR